MLKVDVRLSPIRLVLGKKETLIVDVIIRNTGDRPALVSAKMRVGEMLCFDMAGLVKEDRKRLGYVKVGGEKTVAFVVRQRPMMKEGEQSIAVEVYEHAPERYDKVDATYSKSTSIRVIR